MDVRLSCTTGAHAVKGIVAKADRIDKRRVFSRFRQLSGAVQDAWVEVVGEENFHRTDLEGTVSFTSDGEMTRIEKQ